jgi:hypothetical protein
MATLAVLGTLAFTTSASAAVVCNDEGDCWRVKDRHNYPPDVNLQIYDDNWTWGDVLITGCVMLDPVAVTGAAVFG